MANNRLTKELLRGRELALQLESILSVPPGEAEAVLADQVLGQIMTSFSESISFVGSCGSPETSDYNVCGDSGESRKRSGAKEGQGCYKRRRGLQSSPVVAPTKEDRYAWRKYGQKDILNSKFPRCYYRCKHKYDQGCKATKQVQLMDNSPTMYQITYLEQHSCRESTKAPLMIPDSDPQIFHQDNLPSDPFTMCVEDKHGEDSASDLTDCISGFDQGFPDLPGFGDSAEPETYFSSWAFSGDGFHGLAETDFMCRHIGIDGNFQFTGNELM